MRKCLRKRLLVLVLVLLSLVVLMLMIPVLVKSPPPSNFRLCLEQALREATAETGAMFRVHKGKSWKPNPAVIDRAAEIILERGCSGEFYDSSRLKG